MRLSQILPIEIPFNTAGKVAWASKTDIPKCPFSGGNSCKKLNRGMNRLRSKKCRWCSLDFLSERLCSTKKDYPLCEHQIQMLSIISDKVFSTPLHPEDICVKREVSLSVVEGKSYHADYIMTTSTGHSASSGPDRLVLEMQGGGETSDTGKLTAKLRPGVRATVQRTICSWIYQALLL